MLDNLNPQIVRLLSEETVRLYQAVPLSLEGEVLTVAMSDGHHVEAIDELSLQTGCQISVSVASPADISAAIDKIFSVEKRTKQTLIDMRLQNLREEKKTVQTVETLEEDDARDALADQPVVKLLKDILMGAIGQKASDIHMEPQDPEMRIRYRIDGALHDVMTIPKSVEAALISRAKVLSDMDITEKRKPQDGHYRFKHNGQSYDIRMACIPVPK
jgi:type IV pilus assembly protein PilB